MASVQEYINTWHARIAGDPEVGKEIDFPFELIVEGAQPAHAVFSALPVVDESKECPLTLRLKDEDFIAITEGRLNPQVAFLTGRLAVTGRVELALRLHPLFAAFMSRR